ncbi:MAG: hypothetical protein AVDCRST_MAG17-1162, partial [uncultured Solirubrobacterales bacterium]
DRPPRADVSDLGPPAARHAAVSDPLGGPPDRRVGPL